MQIHKSVTDPGNRDNDDEYDGDDGDDDNDDYDEDDDNNEGYENYDANIILAIFCNAKKCKTIKLINQKCIKILFTICFIN